MADRSALFAAHCPHEGYLEKHCDHYYCDFLSVAVLRRAPEHFVKPFTHAHEPYEFLLPLTPTPQIMHGDAVYFGKVGYAYPVRSGVRHAQAVEVCDVSNCNITVDKAYLERRLAEKGLPVQLPERYFPISEKVMTYLELFQTEFNKGDGCDKSDLDCLGALIVSSLIEDACRPRPQPQTVLSNSVMDEIDSYINTHFSEKISLDELVERSGFTKSHFMAQFKKHCGEAPYARITRLRLAKSKVLLRGTDYPVAKIARLCGFPSSNAFANLFRKDTAMTPSAFRRLR